MSLLEDPQTTTGAPTAERQAERPTRRRPLSATDADHHDIDLTDRGAGHAPRHPDPGDRGVHGAARIGPSGRTPWRGMRIRRVRLASVATLAAVFWVLAFAILLGSVVLVWNVARSFGFITEIEEVVTTSLGLDDPFEIEGAALFRVAAAATAFLTALGWVMTVLMAAVYNAACAVFGGLAVETGPLQRRRRVRSRRHRRSVTTRS